MQTLLPDTRIQRSCIPSDCAGGERMLSRVYGRLECRCYSDYLPKACSLGWDCPAVPSASCSQMWSELSNLPIDSWTTNPFSPSAFGCTRRIGLQSSISVHNRNQIEDWVIPFSAHYLSLAETQNTHKPFMTKPADKSYGTCWGQQRAAESLLRAGGGISAVKAAQKSSIVSRIMHLGELDLLGPAELHCTE